jgi:GABA permease
MYRGLMVESASMRRYLVVANQILGGTGLADSVQQRAKEGYSIHVVVPATEPADERVRPEGTAAENAQRRLGEALARFRAAGVEATGTVGPADPMEAMRHALAADAYMGIIISTLPAGVSRWLHMDLPHRMEREFKLPVEWVEARSEYTSRCPVQTLPISVRTAELFGA